MKINVETDKRVNVYALWEGKQIILCKKQQKRTPIGGDDWVGLWPTMSGEDLMLRREKPSKNVDFILSDKGLEYLRKIHYSHRKNKYMAKVEYIPIDGKQRRLWERLEEINEFVLWNIDDGPMKYFENSNHNYLAIYRVYVIDYEVKESDVRDMNGRLSSYHKKLDEDASSIVVKNLTNAKPVLSDSEFKERRKKILEIANEYPPGRRVYRPQYRHIPEREITPTIFNEDVEPESVLLESEFKERIKTIFETENEYPSERKVYTPEYRHISERNITSPTHYEDVELESTPMKHKYCIYCRAKLHPSAKYCYKCGKEQLTVQ